MIPRAADAVEEQIVEREHHALRAGLSLLQGAIDDAHRMPPLDLADRVARTSLWLRREVLPHLAWEEAWLYPRLDEAAGSPWATRGLRVQHEQVRELAGALEGVSSTSHEHWTGETESHVVAAMARLDAVISAHLAQEELTVLPLLDARAVR